MGYFNRFVLFLYALAIAVFALGVVVLCLHVIPMYALINEFKFVLSRQETLIGAGVVFLLSVYMIGCSFCCGNSSSKNEKDILLLKGSDGIVKVSTDAIKNMVEKRVMAMQSVREAKADIKAQSQNGTSSLVRVEIETILGTEQNVVEVSDLIKSAVSQDLEQVAGIPDHEVEVLVKDISSTAVSKKKRVV